MLGRTRRRVKVAALTLCLASKVKKKNQGHCVTGAWMTEGNVHWGVAFGAECGTMLYK